MTTVTRLSERYELGFIRLFDAPVDKVWQAWTDPAQLTRWWGPELSISCFIIIDFHIGGTALWSTRSPAGRDVYYSAVYRDIKPLKKIVYTQSFADRHGNYLPSSYYEIPGNWPSQVIVTVIFEDWEGKTRLSLRQSGIPEEMKQTIVQDWNESLDKLAEFVKQNTGNI